MRECRSKRSWWDASTTAGGVSWFAHAGEEGREGEGGRNVLVKGGGRTVV